MRKLAVLVFLLVAGCDATDFYKQDTRTWFGLPPAPPAEKKGQTPAVGKTDTPPPQ
jgi:hypothetical protein